MDQTQTYDNSPSSTTILLAIFNKSNIVMLLWFIVIYYILYIILQVSKQSEVIPISRFFDIVIFGIVILYTVVNYMALCNIKKGRN